MDEQQGNEIRALSHFALVMTLTAFSVVLILFNFLLGWEKWTIPICFCALVTCIVMHVVHKPQENVRIYCYSLLLLVELFYYCANVQTVYDSTPVIIVVLVVMTMTQEKKLTMACIAVGYFGMLYRTVVAESNGEVVLDLVHIVRTGWHYIMVAIAAIVVLGIMDAVTKMVENFSRDIETLENVNRSATDFLANVSHEIRTPVNAIIGLSGVCIEKEQDEEIRKDMRSVEQAGRRVAEQISDILDYSEIDMDYLAVNEEDYMLSSILNDLVTQIRPIKPQELELVIDIDPAVPAVLHSDVTKLKKIMWHLIANGMKYTREGGVYVRISSVAETYGVNLCIEVTDTGIGMSDEEMERISERFYQANSGRTRSTSGLGLGMAIVSGFVSAMHGFMTIDSKRGKGTTVRVSIPQKVMDPSECMAVKNRDQLSLGAFLHFDKFENAEVREFYDSMLWDLVSGLRVQMHKVETVDNLKKLVDNLQLTHLFVGAEEYCSDISFMEKIAEEILVIVVADQSFELPSGSKARLMKKPFYCFPVIGVLNMEPAVEEQEGKILCPGVHALVVDDEPMNLMVARGIFKRYEMEVSTATSGMEAIQLCSKNHYDIIFMDHMMPEMDGVETMRKIRAEVFRGKAGIPIVALTANAVSTAKEMFLSEGFDGFVSKPVDLMELERVLKRVLPKTSIISVTDEESELFGLEMRTETAMQENLPAQNEKENPAPEREDQEDLSGKTGGKEFEKLKEYGLNIEKGLFYCQGDEGLYRELLLQFAGEEKEKQGKLEQYLSENRFQDYAIIIHAVKSTAKMIGAGELSEAAKNLEMSSKQEQAQALRSEHPGTMRMYSGLAEGIRSVLGPDVSGSGESAADAQDQAVKSEDMLVLNFEPERGDNV